MCHPSALLGPRCLEVGEKQTMTQHKLLPLSYTSSQFGTRIPPTPELWAYLFLTCLSCCPGPDHPGLSLVGSDTKIPPWAALL